MPQLSFCPFCGSVTVLTLIRPRFVLLSPLVPAISDGGYQAGSPEWLESSAAAVAGSSPPPPVHYGAGLAQGAGRLVQGVGYGLTVEI